MELELIKNDHFGIAERLKEIDSRYTLYFNHVVDRYEVYIGELLAVIVPYDELDERTLDYVKWRHTLMGDSI